MIFSKDVNGDSRLKVKGQQWNYTLGGGGIKGGGEKKGPSGGSKGNALKRQKKTWASKKRGLMSRWKRRPREKLSPRREDPGSLNPGRAGGRGYMELQDD